MIGAIYPLLMLMLVAALALCLVRLVRGPSLPDRVLALDLMALLGIALIVVYTLATGQNAFLDVAVVLALLSFLSTIAFAIYIERQALSAPSQQKGELADASTVD